VKQTIFVSILMMVGALGALFVEPFVGVAVYYLFAVLRPQWIWEWALPRFEWTEVVAWPTIVATIWFLLNRPVGIQRPPLSAAHKMFFAFGAWICLTYVTSENQEVAWRWFLEYIKLFTMFAIASVTVYTMRHICWLYGLTTLSLIYIAYELNFLYVFEGRLDIYHVGYGGLDNNGAGLMLAMAVPLAIHAWEGLTNRWRWLFIGSVPLIVHAVLMSYSRGAMLSLLVSAPLLVLRSRRKRQFAFLFVLLVCTVPYLAGNEIRQRFLSIEGYRTDGSANARFNSWEAAFAIANDYPVFGVGIRNANLITYRYGADMKGRTIHSQYLQTMADNGYPGLFLYILALGCTWVGMARARRRLKKLDSPDAKVAHSMLNGAEGALFVFCFGALFLSLEVFELPYLIALIGAQINALTRLSHAEGARVPAVAPLPIAPQRA
jgi:probable O-glycosylation ligase (exosortase A-associated)